MSHASPLIPASRIFACELPGSTFSFEGGIFVVGVLTEKLFRGETISALRVSDSTGVFSFSMNPGNAALLKAAEALEEPCFVAVYAEVRHRSYTGKAFYDLIVQALEPTTREARDAWLHDTASSLSSRLSERQDTEELQKQISAAISAIKPAKPAIEISDEQIFEVIESISEKKGAPLTAVVEELKKLGMSENVAKAKLQQLSDDGDLYSPVKGNIKVL